MPSGVRLRVNRGRTGTGAVRFAALLSVLIAGLLSGFSPVYAAPPRLASDPGALGADLAADEQTLRNPSSTEPALTAAALRQQAAYRVLGLHPDWAPTARTRIPQPLLGVYDRNIDARRALVALTPPKDTMPPWRIVAPAPAADLLGYYREAQAATGVDWSYLAAINMVETGFGRINGVSEDDAQGPMQFLPSTFAAYGDGGDIHSPRDSITAAGRLLAANGFAANRDRAIFAYNHSDLYVRAVNDYAAVMASDPVAFGSYYRWDTYYRTTAGDVLLPIGYVQSSRIPVAEYLAGHPQ